MKLHSEPGPKTRFVIHRGGIYPEYKIYLGEYRGITLELYYMYDKDMDVRIKVSGGEGANCTFMDLEAAPPSIWSDNGPVVLSFISHSSEGRFAFKYHCKYMA